MPAYGTQTPPLALFPFYPESQVFVHSAETVTAGESSQQLHLPPGPVAGQKGIRVEVDFSADPGNFEFYVQESDDDSLGSASYQLVPSGGDITQATKTAGPNGANTRVATDLIPIAGQFCDLYWKTPPSNGSIKVTARITRAA